MTTSKPAIKQSEIDDLSIIFEKTSIVKILKKIHLKLIPSCEENGLEFNFEESNGKYRAGIVEGSDETSVWGPLTMTPELAILALRKKYQLKLEKLITDNNKLLAELKLVK